MNASTPLPEPWHNPWPADGLESVPSCPVCGEGKRDLLHADLEDRIFRVAPGRWKLWKCARCGSAYLNPRPTPDSIHAAYAIYHTHIQRAPHPTAAYEDLNTLRRLRRRLANGYTNWRYSTQSQPASVLGRLLAYANPAYKHTTDSRFRHLPPNPKGNGRLLDVGCGNGAFLRLAKTCGWEVTGIDPDPNAAAVGQGFPVYLGGIEVFDGQKEIFDVITLSHVIEHTHAPIDVLRGCHALLKKRGQLWIETPNITALGHARFGRHWRGLEPPRHLVLFNRASLQLALQRAGFRHVQHQPRPDPCVYTFQASWSLEIGLPYTSDLPFPEDLRQAAKITAIKATFFPSRREFLTLTANR